MAVTLTVRTPPLPPGRKCSTAVAPERTREPPGCWISPPVPGCVGFLPAVGIAHAVKTARQGRGAPRDHREASTRAAMILIDTTPLVALCDARDSRHRVALKDLEALASARLGVCEAVLMEACFHLPSRAQRHRLRAALDQLHIARCHRPTTAGSGSTCWIGCRNMRTTNPIGPMDVSQCCPGATRA